ncbi:hypothetical protein IFM89_018683 [Coptis chinensis]|uniref:Uncharacterized protein n=1 Tax=Coptis chinensis TaxID=261450 RepID=A0A835ID00_9MAGN|nr:hypothetical protein IFM89_018683 [Coptis chinensis]
MSGGAYLYKQLSLASQHGVRQFCGFAALVEVTWDPYRDVRVSFSFDEVSFFSGCLCCLDDLAAYHQDRVLRQFGRVQGIPLKRLIPELDTSTPRNYKIIYPNIQGHQWSQWFNHVLNETMRGTAIVDSSYCDPKYIEWYYSVSHPRVQNPVRCSGLFKRASVVARPTYDELVCVVTLNSQEVSKTTSLPCPKRKASKKASHLRPHLLVTLPRVDLRPEVTREVVKDRLTRLFACHALLLAKERVGEGYNWQAGILSTNASSHTAQSLMQEAFPITGFVRQYTGYK